MAFSSENAIEYLQRARANDRLAHAYLISGAAGSGKRALASEIAVRVNDLAPQNVFETRPSSVHIAEPESKSRRIVIEQIRDLERTLQMRAENGRRKVGIIVDADRLQPQAANAFLKTLEEPPNDSLLLLLSAVPEVLPDTILSRCLTIPLALENARELSTDETELIDFLNAAALGKSGGVQSAYRLAQDFQRLLAGIRENIQNENAAALKREETKYKNTTDGAWLDEREDYFKALTESQYLQRRGRLLEILFLWWADVLRANTGLPKKEFPAARGATESVAQKISAPQILRRLQRLEELRDHFGRNIQEALAIEVAFLNVFAF